MHEIKEKLLNLLNIPETVQLVIQLVKQLV